MQAWRNLPTLGKVSVVAVGVGTAAAAVYYVKTKAEATVVEAEHVKVPAPPAQTIEMSEVEVIDLTAVDSQESIPSSEAVEIVPLLDTSLVSNSPPSPPPSPPASQVAETELLSSQQDVSLNETLDSAEYRTPANNLSLDDTLNDAFINETVINVSVDEPIAVPTVADDVHAEKQPSESVDDTKINDSNAHRKVLLLGLDGSGKSALLKALSQEAVVNAEYSPTQGFNVVCISNDEMDLSIWEIGGKPTYRDHWPNFLKETDVIMFAVDQSDRERFQEVKKFFDTVMSNLSDPMIPVLLILTKSDQVANAEAEEAAATDIEALLDIDNLKRQVTVQSICVREKKSATESGIEDLQNILKIALH